MRVFVVLVLCLTIQEGWTCRCFGTHIQNRICSDAVVFHGMVSSVAASPSNSYRINNVFVEEIYKDPSGLVEAGSSIHVWTADQASLCAIRLDVGKHYLIDASYDGERLEMNGCHETREWPEDETNAAALRSSLLHEVDCSCQVRVCEHPMAGIDNYLQCLSTPPGPNECVMDKYGAYADLPNCNTDNSACLRATQDSSCSWKPSLPSGCIDSAFPQPPHPPGARQ